MELSKDAKKMLAVIYKAYLEKRKNGESKELAKEFPDGWISTLFPNENAADCRNTLKELEKAFGITENILGDFTLSDEAIVQMEQRFPHGLESVLKVLSLIKP